MLTHPSERIFNSTAILVVAKITLARSSERILNPMRYTGYVLLEVNLESPHLTLQKLNPQE